MASPASLLSDASALHPLQAEEVPVPNRALEDPDDEALGLLGFKWKPSYKTVWHWIHKRIRPDGLEMVHAALMDAINEALKAQGINLGWKVVGDASPLQAIPRDKEAGYNGYYKMVCYLVHRLICNVTNLTLG